MTTDDNPFARHDNPNTFSALAFKPVNRTPYFFNLWLSTSLSVAPGPSRPAQDEQDFLTWVSYIERWGPGEDGVGAGRCTSTIHASIIGVCLGRFHCLQSSCRAFGLTERRPAAPLLLFGGFFALIHPCRALGSTRRRHHGLPFGLVGFLCLQPGIQTPPFTRGRIFLSHAEAGWNASTPTARNFFFLEARDASPGRGMFATSPGTLTSTYTSDVGDILPNVTIKH